MGFADSLRLDGRTAVVTGAGRGLGRGCALALAELGAHVVAAARSADELKDLAAEIRADGGSAEAAVLDVTDSDAVRRVFSELPRVDVLVNNAGWNRPQHFFDVEEPVLDAMLALNVKAAFIVAQAAAQRMAEGGEGGSIVNMSSQMGHVGGPERTVYCATKHALEGMTKAMAIELAPHRIRANTVGPDFRRDAARRAFPPEQGIPRIRAGQHSARAARRSGGGGRRRGLPRLAGVLADYRDKPAGGRGLDGEVSAAARACNSGTTSASNHGFSFSQLFTRQLGCGVGRKSGR